MPRPDYHDRIAAQRVQREAQQRLRRRTTILHRDGTRCEVDVGDGSVRWLLNFSGNDYLGLAQQFSVVAAAQYELGRGGAGSSASHLVCGHAAVHDALERELADWLQVQRALLFGNGYLANLGVLQALLGKQDVCVQDRRNHASLIDAARLAGCILRRYPHGDAHAALRQLRTVPEAAAMIATDGVFSMDGDLAPLHELALVARAQGALLYVDDAHGIGVAGPDGRGSLAAHGLAGGGDILQLATLGKALGGYGAALAGDADLIDHLAQSARPYIYTTALPPAQAAAALAAVKLVRREHWRREKLGAAIERFRSGAQAEGLELMPSDTPIQPLPCGSEGTALALAQALAAAGFWVVPIRPPTVPEGGSRLRITLSVLHTSREIDALVMALAQARDAIGVRA